MLAGIAYLLMSLPSVRLQASDQIPLPTYQNPNDIHTATSPSGAYELTIAPRGNYGAGPADYKMVRNGQIIWHSSKQFNLLEPVVGNQGDIIGCSLTNGVFGMGGNQNNGQHLQIWHLGQDGKEKQIKDYPQHYWATDAPLLPQEDGVILCEPSETVLIRIRGVRENIGTTETSDDYLLIDAHSGEMKGAWDPHEFSPENRRSFLVQFAPVGSDLVAVAWQNDQHDLNLSVADFNGKQLWSKSYTKGFSWTSGPVDDVDHDVFLPSTKSDEFAARIGKRRVEFLISNVPGMQSVTEQTSIDYDPSALRMAKLKSVPLVQLPLVKTIALKSKVKAVEQEIHGVRHFIGAGSNRFAYIENWISSDGNLVLVNTSGKVLGKFLLSTLKEPKDNSFQEYAWLKGTTVLLPSGAWNRSGQAQFWKVDVVSGAHSLIALKDTNWQQGGPRFSALSDGTIIAVGPIMRGNDDASVIEAFSEKGKKLWTVDARKPFRIHTTDIAVDTKDRIYLLDRFEKVVHVLSAKGKLLKTIPAKYTEDDGYATSFSVDPQGGFVIYDNSLHDGSADMFRFSPRGKLISSFRPHRSDGKTFLALNAVRFDAEGHYWSSDERTLVKLDSNGAVTKSLGGDLNPDAITSVIDGDIDKDGNIFVVDETTNLHVFNPDGSSKFVFKTKGMNFPNNRVSGLSVNRDSSVNIGTTDKGEVRISRDGKFVGFYGSPPGEYFFGQTSQDAKDGLRWMADMGLVLQDAAGQAAKNIMRRADGGNLGMVMYVKTASDGSACVQALPPLSGGLAMPSGHNMISTFDPDGTPKSNFELPDFKFAMISGFDGKRVMARTETEIYAFDLNGKAIWRTDLKFIPNRAMWSLTKDGRYLFICKPDEVKFYALPTG